MGGWKDAQLIVVVVVGERKDAQLIVDRQLAQLTHGTDSPVARTQQVYYSSAMMMSVSARLVLVLAHTHTQPQHAQSYQRPT